MLESFFRTHRFLVEHMGEPMRRALMDEVDWRQRLIGIKGSRGVGKTTFLLQYAREHFGVRDRRCLYINMNNFHFQGQRLYQFAREFHAGGGKVLLVDQVFKDPDWSQELRRIYDDIHGLRVVFTGSSVMRLKEENACLSGKVASYNLRGFSLREYVNLHTGQNLPSFGLNEIRNRHERIVRQVLSCGVNPMDYMEDYLHHGYYPFHVEKSDFGENLLKTMNMMMEVDILLIKQIDLKYLSKIKKLLYLLAIGGGAPNVSQLAIDMQTSRATVMNYIKYLSEARLLNMIYRRGDSFPKKPASVMMHNPNLVHAMMPAGPSRQTLMETFFQNALWGRHSVEMGERSTTFLVNGKDGYRICLESPGRKRGDVIYALADCLEGHGQEVPLWLYGFLY